MGGKNEKTASPWWPKRKRNVQMVMVEISGQIPVMLHPFQPPGLNRQVYGITRQRREFPQLDTAWQKWFLSNSLRDRCINQSLICIKFHQHFKKISRVLPLPAWKSRTQPLKLTEIASNFTHPIPILLGKQVEPGMRNRHPHRGNVGNILAICLPIVTM